MEHAELSIIQYIDLSQIQGVSTQDFFEDDGNTICTLTIVGWVLDVVIDGVELVKIVYINDDDGCENSEGMVIPVSCILKRARLVPDIDPDTIMDTEDMN